VHEEARQQVERNGAPPHNVQRSTDAAEHAPSCQQRVYHSSCIHCFLNHTSLVSQGCQFIALIVFIEFLSRLRPSHERIGHVARIAHGYNGSKHDWHPVEDHLAKRTVLAAPMVDALIRETTLFGKSDATDVLHALTGTCQAS